MSDVKVEVKTLDDLEPDPNNVNKHTVRGHTLVENSMRKRGAFRSVAAAGKGVDKPVVMAGNLTIEKARDAGFKEVIFVHTNGQQLVSVIRDDIEPGSAEAIALGLEDNESAARSYSPDIDVLAALAAGDNAVLSELRTQDKIFDGMLQGMGLKDETQDAPAEMDRAAELLEKWQVKTGDLWQIGEHRLICGDCTDAAVVQRLTDGENCGACVTDPPYGQNQIDVTGDEPENHAELLRGCVEKMPIENGIVIAFQSPRTFPNWMQAIINHKFLRALWLYKEAQMANPWRGWIMKSEMILMSEIGKGEWLDVHPFAHDCYKLSEVSYRTEGVAAMRPHGSVKPLVVVQDLVSRVGGDVYEPFCGSGTTMAACQNLERKCRAVEIDAKYVAVALERMSQAFPALEIKRLA